ncbi:MAG: T9SS type A sorting domain-containing protein, partial [Chitinophagales bacterium]|nr:T9SS type A sorting domain-containing protein [Chitinophagales bacterium]
MKYLKIKLLLVVFGFYAFQAHSQLYLGSNTNITIQDGAKLFVHGVNLINNTYVKGDGNLVLTGSTASNISGVGKIDNLEIDNSAGVSIATNADSVKIVRALYPTSGQLNVNGNLVLLSDINGTARIAEGSVTGNYISGDINVQRYIPAKFVRKWSFLSSPVTGTIQNTWQQIIHITGPGTGGTVCPSLTPHTNGYDATISSAPSIYVYDASQNTGSRWIVPSSTNAYNVGAGKGFRVNIRGDRSIGCSLINGDITYLRPSEVTLKASGSLSNLLKNAGNFTITYANNLVNNYVFVGNPYPSPISFNSFEGDNNANINYIYAVYVPASIAGVYSYWDGTSFTGGTGYDNSKGDIIGSGQAFFVQSKLAGNITLSFKETQKTDGKNVGYFRGRNFNEKIRIHYLQNDGTQMDEVIIRFANDANISNTEEGSLDIASMNSGTNYITSLKGNKGMVIQTRKLQTLAVDTVWLNVASTISGTYKLAFNEFDNFLGTEIFLIDNYTNTLHDIKTNPEYEFTVDKDNAATKGIGRFGIVFNRQFNPELTLNSTIKMFPNPSNKLVTIQLPQSADNSVNYNIKVSDIAGKVVMQFRTTNTTEQFDVQKLSKGIYVVEIIDSKGNRTTEKLVKN